ncbi:MAG: hypothetical protein GX280_04395 [Lentisphaerae bacterium]|nr:hypothetical protein [Lentisphaerota bacterium]
MNFFKHCLFLCGIAAGIVFFTGCSSFVNAHRQKEQLMSYYLSGRNEQTKQIIDDKLRSTSGAGDEVMWLLEAGSFNFNTGNFAASLENFRSAEKLIAEYDERAVVSIRDAMSESATTLTNLNTLPYRGFCRDRIALSFFKSLSYLGDGNEAAFRAQLRRLRDEQKNVIENYQKIFDAAQAEVYASNKKNQRTLNADSREFLNQANSEEFNASYQQLKTAANRGYGYFLNPAAIFLSGLGNIRDGLYDNAKIDFKRLYEARPQSRLFQQYYVTVLRAANQEIPPELKSVESFNFPLAHDCIYLIFANGRSAALKQVSISFPVMAAWPMCRYFPAPYRKLQIAAGGKNYETSLLSDMDGIISQEFDELLPGLITRIVISTAIKETGSYAAFYAANQAHWALGLAVLLSSSLYRSAFNTADTRSWEILPKEFQLAQFPVPTDRRIVIAPDGIGGKARTIELPPDCRSAIIFINAPSAEVFSTYILPMNQ